MGRNQSLLKGNPLVTRQHRLTRSDQTVSVAYRRWYMGDLIAAWLALAGCASELAESFEEERLDIVRLQTAGSGSLHVFPDTGNTADVHHIMRQSTLFEQVLKLRCIDGVCDGLRQLGANLWAVTITDSLDQQITQRPALELNLSKHVEYLTSKGLAGLLQLLQQGVVDVALTRLLGYQVPEMADFCLPDTVNAAEALLNPVGVPGQVIVHHQVGTLKVDSLSGGVCSNQHLYHWIMFEGRLRLSALLATHAAVDDHRSILATKQGCDTGFEIAQRIAVLSENDELLMWGASGRRNGGSLSGRFPGRGCRREYLTKEAGKFKPLPVLAAAAYGKRQCLQTAKGDDFGLQLANGSSSSCLVEDFLLGSFHLIIGRLIKVLNVILIEGGACGGNGLSLCPALQNLQLPQPLLKALAAPVKGLVDRFGRGC